MWQLLLLSLYLLVGTTADLFSDQLASAHAKHSGTVSLGGALAATTFSSKQSAGQRYRPEERSGLPKLG